MKIFSTIETFILGLVTAIYIYSCATISPAPGPSTPSDLNQIVLTHLTDQMLWGEPGNLCPNYGTKVTDAKKFWLNLVNAIIKAESGGNPKSKYVEKTMGIDPITGKQVESDGLLQLSCQDVSNYKTPECNLMDCKKFPEAIFDGPTNLVCGLSIANRLMEKHPGKIQNALGHYWSTARPYVIHYDKKGNQVFDGAYKREQAMKKTISECFQ